MKKCMNGTESGVECWLDRGRECLVNIHAKRGNKDKCPYYRESWEEQHQSTVKYHEGVRVENKELKAELVEEREKDYCVFFHDVCDELKKSPHWNPIQGARVSAKLIVMEADKTETLAAKYREGLEAILTFECDGDHAPEDSEFCTACIAKQALEGESQ